MDFPVTLQADLGGIMSFMALSRLLVDGRNADHPVAFKKGKLITFSTLKADVMGTASRVAGCRHAALLCQDSYYFIVGFLALLHAGATPVLPQNSSPKALEGLEDEFEYLVDDAFMDIKTSAGTTLAPIDSRHASLLLFTSGSTGTPKKIKKNVDMLEKEIAIFDQLWGQNSGRGPVHATVSHQHVYGLTFKLLWPLVTGRPFVSETSLHWEDLCATLTGDSMIISSPAHLDRLEGLDPLPAAGRPARIFSAGSLLSHEASQKTAAIFGCPPTEIFGSTETGAIATRCLIRGNEPWIALPGVRIDHDEKNQLVVYSPFAGQDRILTSDLIEQTPTGFHFRGRSDRVVKIEGKRVALDHIEQSLVTLPFVQMARVTLLAGKPDRLAAVIVPSAEGRVALEDMGPFRFGRLLRRELSEGCEASSLPRQWRFLEALPQQGTGKIPEATLHALFREAP